LEIVMRSHFRNVFLLSVPFLVFPACSSDGTDSGGPEPQVEQSAEVDSILLSKGSLLLTSDGESYQLSATALDEDGDEIPGTEISWMSLKESTATVSGDGLVTAQTGVGSAQIIAYVDDVESVPLVVAIAVPLDSTTIITDEEIVSIEVVNTAEDDWDDPLETLQVHLTVSGLTAAELGTHLVSDGDYGAGGEILSAVDGTEGVEIVLVFASPEEMFEEFLIDEEFVLSRHEFVVNEEIAPYFEVTENDDGSYSFTLKEELSENDGASKKRETDTPDLESFFSKLDCSGGAGLSDLIEVTTFNLSFVNNLGVPFRWNWPYEGFEVFKVTGSIDTTISMGVLAKVGLDAEISCKVKFGDVPILLPPPLGVFVSPEAEVGAGFGLEGAFTAAQAEFSVESTATLEVDVGVEKTDGEWSFPHTLEPNFTEPEKNLEISDGADDLRLEFSASVFAYLEANMTVFPVIPFLPDIDLNMVEFQAGLALPVVYALEDTQARNGDMRSSTQLNTVASLTILSQLDRLGKYIGISVTPPTFEAVMLRLVTIPPSGIIEPFAVSPLAGEPTEIVVTMDDASADQTFLPYNIKEVVVYLLDESQAFGHALEEIGRQTAYTDQLDFVFTHTFTAAQLETNDDSSGTPIAPKLVAFVDPVWDLIPNHLYEIAEDSRRSLIVADEVSCYEILSKGLSEGDGWYPLDWDGDGTEESVFCDMNTHGGGWTRCAWIDYIAETQVVVRDAGDNIIVSNDSGNVLGDGGVQAIKSACFDSIDEAGFGLTHTIEGSLGGPYDHEYWATVEAPVSSAQDFYFRTDPSDAGETYECSNADSVNVTWLSYPDSLPRWVLFGDDGSHTCTEDGVYLGSTTDGCVWLDYEETIESNTWVELSNTQYGRLGVTLTTDYDPDQGCEEGQDPCRMKLDGVLEFWVR
jgi:hypothetical protein